MGGGDVNQNGMVKRQNRNYERIETVSIENSIQKLSLRVIPIPWVIWVCGSIHYATTIPRMALKKERKSLNRTFYLT